jgi:hypothetical protein
MALQLSLRRGFSAAATTASSRGFASVVAHNNMALLSQSQSQTRVPSLSSAAAASYSSPFVARRWQSSSSADAGDVIGIDLGTTNSCVAIMVRSWVRLVVPGRLSDLTRLRVLTSALTDHCCVFR